MRLCVIGNSHLGALKLGWDLLKARGEAPDLEPTFFGAPADRIRYLRFDGRRLTPKREEVTNHFNRMAGVDHIELDRYDAFLLVGLSVSIKRIMRFYKTHAWVGMKGTAGKELVHPGFARDFLTERYSETLMTEMLAYVAGRKALALAEPLWAEWVRDRKPEGPDYGWDQALAAGDGETMGQMFRETVAAAMPAHAKFLPQPPDTVRDGITTRMAFNKDASRLISGEGEGSDAAHMNGEYGAALWPLVLPALAGM